MEIHSIKSPEHHEPLQMVGGAKVLALVGEGQKGVTALPASAELTSKPTYERCTVSVRKVQAETFRTENI